MRAGKVSLHLPRRVGREPFGTTFGAASSVIADFQREASSWPRRRKNISRYCNISGVCRQENFPPPSCAAFAESRAGPSLATRLRSRRKWLVREAAVAVEFAAQARSRPPSRSRSGNATPFRYSRLERATGNHPAVDRMVRRGSGPNEKSRGVRSRMRLRLQRNDHAPIALILISRKKIPTMFEN